MGQIEDLRLFVAVVDQGGIARAADTLGIAKSAVSRRLGQLESRYDVRLIDRQPRNWEVTKAGQELYQRAHAMVADADDLDADFMHAPVSMDGPLRVSIAREFGMSFLRPTLYAFLRAHPGINLTVDFDDRLVDLDAENYDLAVRITSGALEGVENMRLGTTCQGLFASSTYTDMHGAPDSPNELCAHALLNYGAERRARWDIGFRGKMHAIEFQPTLNSNSGPFLMDAAINGLGIVRLPDFIAAEAVRARNLVAILPESDFPEYGIHLIHASNRRINKRMRTFITALEHSCKVLGS